MNFFRIQEANLSLEEMQSFNSADGGDGYTEGLCVSDTPDNFGGAWQAHGDDAEVIILRGQVLNEIYDGYRIRPSEIVARFSKAEWREKINDESAWDYEDWL